MLGLMRIRSFSGKQRREGIPFRETHEQRVRKMKQRGIQGGKCSSVWLVL